MCALRVSVALQHLSVARAPLVDDADKGRALDVCFGCVCRVAAGAQRFANNPIAAAHTRLYSVNRVVVPKSNLDVYQCTYRSIARFTEGAKACRLFPRFSDVVGGVIGPRMAAGAQRFANNPIAAQRAQRLGGRLFPRLSDVVGCVHCVCLSRCNVSL